jgi:hypothetical protein
MPAVVRHVIGLPAVDQIPELSAATTASFPWGSAVGSVGYRPSNDQADDGAGPAVGAVDDAGDVYVFDQVNWRIAARVRGTVSVYALDASAEPVFAAVFDAKHRLVVAGLHHFMAFASDGRLEGRWPRSEFAPVEDLQILSLQVRDRDLVANYGNAEWVLLADRGNGYVPSVSAAFSAAVHVQLGGSNDDTLTISTPESEHPTAFDVGEPEDFTYIPLTRRLPDGSIVAVLKVRADEDVASVDVPELYLLIRLQPDGSAQFATFRAASARLTNPYGPVMSADDLALSVLSGSTTAGVRVDRYRYTDLPG